MNTLSEYNLKKIQKLKYVFILYNMLHPRYKNIIVYSPSHIIINLSEFKNFYAISFNRYSSISLQPYIYFTYIYKNISYLNNTDFFITNTSF
jgi:hypothetical protein